MSWQVVEADCVNAMREMDEASIDAVVTDPPYGLSFMGREWDSPEAWSDGYRTTGATPQSGRRPVSDQPGAHDEGYRNMRGKEKQMQDWHYRWAVEALRVLKPGGFLLAFGGARTYHRLACAVEDAGFEIRDRVLALGSDGKGGDAVRELGAELDWLYSSGFP